MKFSYILISIFIHIILFFVFSLNLKKESSAWALEEKKIEVNFSTGSVNPIFQAVDSTVEKVNETEIKRLSEKIVVESKDKIEKNKSVKSNTVDDSPKTPETSAEEAHAIQDNVKNKDKVQETLEGKTSVSADNLSNGSPGEESSGVAESADKTVINSVETKSISEEVLGALGENFVQTGDGNWAAKNQNVDGLEIIFFNTTAPKYPNIARKLGFKNEFTVKVRFLIGLDGKVEEIKFYSDEAGKKFGFESEVKKALYNWRISPVQFKGKTIKVYFYKAFKFKL